MSKPQYILDVPLPKSQNFSLLKEEGLEYIQQCSGNTWTNLNPSDPGVTILDQVCYALTELGYCNDFDVKDILTNVNGQLQLKDQFYLPEEILTTAPVTITDYRKYLIDGVDGIQNAIIVPAKETNPAVKAAYQVYLLIDPAVTGQETISNICKAAFFYLNKSRNLGELFLMPQALKPVSHLLNVSIEIENEKDVNRMLLQINEAIRNYIFPKILPIGYKQLADKGYTVNEIFNGPLLENGWIETTSLGEKRNSLNTIAIAHVIGAVPGITAVSVAGFDSSLKEVQCNPDQLITIDVMGSVSKGFIEISSKGKILLPQPEYSSTGKLPENWNIVFGTETDIHAEIPKGKFRDINSYYSIQNTFPEIFGVGPDAIIANAADFQIAQSRQLKGYLSLFDQVLANQFSQLANIGKLFSFKNVTTGTPSDRSYFYAEKNKLEKHQVQYPVPYRSFAPTYFYQSLYDVPHIRPLLKGHDAFDFTIEHGSEKELEHKSWKAYKEDPYNPYMHGLMEFVEDETTSLERRNNLLDHLLARHGESPDIIDAIIEGSQYSGDAKQDQVIFKSLYLQNLGLLSYYRQSAYNYIGVGKISAALPELPANFDVLYPSGNTIDSIFFSEKIDREEKLQEKDFFAYSALELKLSLLFGLKTQYRDFVVNNSENTKPECQLALWMIQQRRGLILIETALLLPGMTTVPNLAISEHDLILIFPSFIPAFSRTEFSNRIELFLEESLPVRLSCKCIFADAGMLLSIINDFVNWHNSLVYQSDAPEQDDKLHSNVLINYAQTLITTLLTALNAGGNE